MAPLFYEKTPPTADDVKLDPDMVSNLRHPDSDDDMVIFTIAQEDAYQFAKDIERNPNGNVSLNEVRRGLAKAAEALTDDTARAIYVHGVDSFIRHQLSQE